MSDFWSFTALCNSVSKNKKWIAEKKFDVLSFQNMFQILKKYFWQNLIIKCVHKNYRFVQGGGAYSWSNTVGYQLLLCQIISSTTYHLHLVHFVLTVIKGKPFINHGKFKKILQILIKIANFTKKIQFLEKINNFRKKLSIFRKKYQFWKKINFEKELSIFRKKLSISKTWQFSGKNGPVSKKLPIFRKKCQFFCKITTVSTQNTNCSVNIFSMDLHGTKRHTVLDQLYAPPPVSWPIFILCSKLLALKQKCLWEITQSTILYFGFMF